MFYDRLFHLEFDLECVSMTLTFCSTLEKHLLNDLDDTQSLFTLKIERTKINMSYLMS